MHRTNIYLIAEQTAALDRIAAEEGVSRAEIIRQLIARFLSGGRASQTADIAAIEASAGVLADLDAFDRETDGRAEHLDKMWRVRA